MTDIDLTLETTEDGRRFIALMGERSDVLFNMDHVFYHSVVLMILAVIILGLIAFVLVAWTCTTGYPSCRWKEHGKRKAVLEITLLGVAAVGVCVAIYWGVDLGLERKLNHIDAELEAIRVRHPEWDGRWIEWRDGHIELCFDGNLTCVRPSNVDTWVLTAEDLGARDWEVGELDDGVGA